MRDHPQVTMSGRAPRSVAACRAAYDEQAAEYARLLDPTLAGLVERMAELADVRPGVKLLDLATGTGTVARAAAARGATVVGVDVSAPMLAVARELSPEIDFRMADAHSLRFSGGEFDVVACGLALSHFHERSRALGEVLRVLRGGGQLVASAWSTGGGIPSLSAVVAALERHGAADTGYALDEETWFYPEQGSNVLRDAGFADVLVKQRRSRVVLSTQRRRSGGRLRGHVGLPDSRGSTRRDATPSSRTPAKHSPEPTFRGALSSTSTSRRRGITQHGEGCPDAVAPLASPLDGGAPR
jgi:SAM-dependent methyltransferase